MQETRLVQRRTLWATIAAPVIWSVHFLGIWVFTEGGCFAGAADVVWFGTPALKIIPLVWSGIALVLLLFVGGVCFRLLNQMRTVETDKDTEYHRVIERTRFMAWTGLGFSVLFGLVSAFLTIPLLVLPLC